MRRQGLNTQTEGRAAARIKEATGASSVVLAATPTQPRDVAQALTDAAGADVSTQEGVQQMLGGLVKAHILGLKRGVGVLPDIIFKESITSLVTMSQRATPAVEPLDPAVGQWVSKK